MPVSFKRNKSYILKKEQPTEIIPQIEKSIENIDLNKKSKSKLLKNQIPKINNKSNVNIYIPNGRKKKLVETPTEINLDTDNDD